MDVLPWASHNAFVKPKKFKMYTLQSKIYILPRVINPKINHNW